MPAPREVSLVTCTCGWRAGDLRRVTGPDEDAADVELTKLRDLVPALVKHWRRCDDVTIHPRAPLAVKAVIAKAARELAADAAPVSETGMVRR